MEQGQSPHAMKTGWRPLVLSAQLGFAALLLVSWFGPLTVVRPYWDALDAAVYLQLNGTLASGDTWRWFWAVANTRMVDAVSALLFAGIFCVYILRGGWVAVPIRVAQGVFLAVFTVFILNLSSNWIFDFERLSPSLVLKPFYGLAGMLGDIKVKDVSGNSFPGDHGTAVVLFTVFIGAFCGRRYGFVAGLLAFALVWPRMISGAHWITDLLVGSASVALVASALALATPLASSLVMLIARVLAGVIQWLVGKRLLPASAASAK